MENLGFDLGLITVGMALLGALVVLAEWTVRYIAAYLNNTEKPKDKLLLKMALAGAFALLVGGMLQHEWNAREYCRAQHLGVFECIFKK